MKHARRPGSSVHYAFGADHVPVLHSLLYIHLLDDVQLGVRACGSADAA